MATTKHILLFLLIVALFATAMAQSFKALAKEEELTKGSDFHLDRRHRGHGQGSLRSYQCPGECSRRCSRTRYRKPCLFFCNKCCAKCFCVPPGFYGHKGVCPCYNNWKTQQGGPKCP
uniref:Snakin 7 n=1 Tax=Allium cepa TaxID=4679 RepID=A0A7D5SLY4_ALLCE|nr:snakin 7 [Allium cepa]